MVKRVKRVHKASTRETRKLYLHARVYMTSGINHGVPRISIESEHNSKHKNNRLQTRWSTTIDLRLYRRRQKRTTMSINTQLTAVTCAFPHSTIAAATRQISALRL